MGPRRKENILSDEQVRCEERVYAYIEKKRNKKKYLERFDIFSDDIKKDCYDSLSDISDNDDFESSLEEIITIIGKLIDAKVPEEKNYRFAIKHTNLFKGIVQLHTLNLLDDATRDFIYRFRNVGSDIANIPELLSLIYRISPSKDYFHRFINERTYENWHLYKIGGLYKGLKMLQEKQLLSRENLEAASMFDTNEKVFDTFDWQLCKSLIILQENNIYDNTRDDFINLVKQCIPHLSSDSQSDFPTILAAILSYLIEQGLYNQNKLDVLVYTLIEKKMAPLAYLFSLTSTSTDNSNPTEVKKELPELEEVVEQQKLPDLAPKSIYNKSSLTFYNQSQILNQKEIQPKEKQVSSTWFSCSIV